MIGLVVKQATVITSTGSLVGSAAAIGFARTIASRLHGIEPFDIVTFGGAGLALVVVALIASAVPSYHASRVDPVAVLRTD